MTHLRRQAPMLAGLPATSKWGRGAFTLIELLVVVAILGVLAAMLLPVLGGVRATARATACRANLGQMGKALSFYLDDHRDCIPRRGQGTRPLASIDRGSDWFNALPPYIGSPSYCDLVAEGRQPQEGDDCVFLCPSASDPGGRYFLPLAQNMYLSPWIRPEPHRIDEIPRPSIVVYMGDAPGQYSSTIPSGRSYSLVARHGGERANLVFLDAHVAAFDGSYLGCGSGDPKRPDVRWETGSSGVNWQERP